jgi:hypothetical protein
MSDATAQCRNCRHFRNDPAYLETAFPGLTSLSSGYGAVRADDGVCLLHDRYLRATYSCGDFRPSALIPASCAVRPAPR